MRRICVIAQREWASLWVTPMGYGVAALFMLGAALIFLAGFWPGGEATMAPTFTGVSWLLAVLTPAVSMRLLSEESKTATLELLWSAPLRDMDIVLGKWLGAMAYLSVLLLLLAVPAGVLWLNGSPDVGQMLCGWAGLWLVAGLYLAMGLLISAATDSQLLAYMASVFLIGLVTLLTAMLPYAAFVGPWQRSAMFYMNVPAQFADFSAGVIDPTNVAFFITGVALFLFLAIQVLAARRQATRRWWEPATSAAAAIGLVVLVNVLVSSETNRLMRSLPYAWQGLVRLDVTSDQAQSLSPRSLRAIGQIDGDYALITTLGPANEANSDVRRVLGLFDRSSRKITVEHLAVGDAAALERVRKSILDRYETANASAAQTLADTERALATLADWLRQDAGTMDKPLQSLGGEIPMAARQRLIVTLDAMNKSAAQLEDQMSAFRESRKENLPAYSTQLEQYHKILQALQRTVLPSVARELQQIGDSGATPATLRNAALEAAQRSRSQVDVVRSLMGGLEAAQIDPQYARLRQLLESGQVVLVLGPQGAAAVALSQSDAGATSGATSGGGWRVSEDELAATLRQMAQQQAKTPQTASVVFVSLDDQPLAKQGGAMRYFASQLAGAGFGVSELSLEKLEAALAPGGKLRSQLLGPGRLFIFPAVLPGRMMEEASRDVRQREAKALQTILDSGASAMVFVSPDLSARALETDPFVSVLRQTGIEPQVDTVLAWLRPISDGGATVSLQEEVASYPRWDAVAGSLDGVPSIVIGACPLTAKPAKNWNTSTIVQVQDPRVWAERDAANLRQPQPTAGAYSGPYAVVMISQRTAPGGGGVMVIGSAQFAQDVVTSNADPGLSPTGIGSAAAHGAAYPGNMEVLMNGAYVLTGQADMTGVSASGRALRRIGAIASGSMTTYRAALVALAPTLVVLAGAWMWTIRRRG